MPPVVHGQFEIVDDQIVELRRGEEEDFTAYLATLSKHFKIVEKRLF